MDIYAIRRHNLTALLGSERGTAAALEEKYGVNSTYLSQLKNGSSRMGEKAARKMEKDLRLPVGFFDQPPGHAESTASLEDIESTLSRASWLPAEDRELIMRVLKTRAP